MSKHCFCGFLAVVYRQCFFKAYCIKSRAQVNILVRYLDSCLPDDNVGPPFAFSDASGWRGY